MADMMHYRLRVEFDKEKVEALTKATERFKVAQQELLSATSAVQTAVYEMQDSLTVKKEIENARTD